MENPFKIIEARISNLENLILDLKYETLPKLLQQQKNEETNQDRLINKKEAAGLLGCSTSTIDNYRRRGDLPLYRIGSAVRFKSSEVLALVKERATKNSNNSNK